MHPRTQCAILECWLSYLFLHWSAKTVLSEDFPSRSGKQHVSSENTSTWGDLWSWWSKKCPRVLFYQAGDCKYFRFARCKCCFHFSPQVLGSESCFPTASELCKDTPRTDTLYHFLRRVQGSVFCECFCHTLFLPWVGRITLSGDLLTLVSKHLAFRKHRYLSRTVVIRKRQMNPCAFLSGLRLQPPCSDTKCCFCH